MSGRILTMVVDANVWLDTFIPTRPRSRESRDFVATAYEQGHNLVYPGHILSTVFYKVNVEAKRTLRALAVPITEDMAHAARSQAWSCVKGMNEIAAPVGVELPDAWLAIKYRELNEDLEDNLVLAACERAKADFLVTSDKQLRNKATVACLAPGDMLAYLRG